ncbi:MAG: endo-1,4-beta-xylanase [Eubacterium sp.]
MRKNVARYTAMALAAVIVCNGAVPTEVQAAKQAKLSKKQCKVIVDKTAEIATKNVRKGTKVSIRYVKKSHKLVSLKWNKKKKVILVRGKRAGKANVEIRFKEGKKNYSYNCKILVKAKAKTKKIPTVAPSVKPNVSSTVEPATSPVPTATATAMVQPTPTIAPTQTPDDKKYTTYEAEYEDDSLPVKDIYKDCFMVGAALNGISNATMALNHKGMAGIIKKHFNSTVLSNLMKPEHLLDEQATKNSKDGMPVCKFNTCDSALNFCKENGIKMRGHTLLWHNQTPEWFFHVDYDVDKELVDAATMEKRMESYIRQVMTHCQTEFPGVIYTWDVVNECICVDADSYVVTSGGWKLRTQTKSDNDFEHEGYEPNYWYSTMGETYVEKAFKYARKYADPGVTLIYNDYNVFQTKKMNNIYKMVEELKEKGLIDGIGLQPTVGIRWPDLYADYEDSFKVCLETYAKLGLELQVTELSFKLSGTNIDEDDLEKQAERYQEFMQLLVDEDMDNGGPCNITSVTVFGICDDYPLYEDNHQNLYLWDKNCVPKPCFYAYIKPGLDLLASKEQQGEQK